MRGRPDGRLAGCRPGGGAGQRAAAAPLTVVRAAKAVNAKAVLAYWTPARLRAAKSADVLVVGSKPHVLPPTAKAPGKPGHVAGGLPRGQAAAAAHPATVKPAAFTYPYPYDSFTPQSSLWNIYPYKVNGKLFFTNNGGNYVCSATSVASASGPSNENEIWTAGHCAANTEREQPPVGQLSRLHPGVQRERLELRPVRRVRLDGAAITTTAWFNNSDLTEDEAAMTVGTSSTTGRTLGQVGGLGRLRLELPGQPAVRGVRVPGRVALQRPQHGRGHRRHGGPGRQHQRRQRHPADRDR